MLTPVRPAARTRFMKKFTLTFTILWAACAFALAGNERYQSKEPVVELPTCAQFGGFNLGLTAGGAFHSWTWNDRDAWVDNFGNDWALGGVGKDRSGVTVGGSMGYDWQKNCALFGLVVDGSWTSIDGSTNYTPTSDPDGTMLRLHESVDFFGTARTRTGIVMDNLLLYITGGFAFANINHSWRIHDTDEDPDTESFSADSFRWGGVAGVGAEWAFNRSWSLRTEFLYAYFMEEHTDGFSPNGNQNVNFDNQDSMVVTRWSLVYRFGGGN